MVMNQIPGPIPLFADVVKHRDETILIATGTSRRCGGLRSSAQPIAGPT
jgi:hypothetical protein